MWKENHMYIWFIINFGNDLFNRPKLFFITTLAKHNYLLSKSFGMGCDTSPSSLMDSTTSLKVKIAKGEGVRVCSLAHNTSGVEGRFGAPRWDQEDWQAIQLFTWTCTNQTTSWLMHSWSTLLHGRTTGKHELTRLITTRIWGKPLLSPL
jgi:hypothetical protein